MNDKNITILFDVQEIYYLSQYLPVHHKLLKNLLNQNNKA